MSPLAIGVLLLSIGVAGVAVEVLRDWQDPEFSMIAGAFCGWGIGVLIVVATGLGS